MINKHGQVVCDVTKIILNDGVTLWPGYIEAKKSGKYIIHNSEDKNNKLPYRKKGKNVNLGVLRNRLKNEQGKDLVKKEEKSKTKLKTLKEDMHFRDIGVMERYLA